MALDKAKFIKVLGMTSSSFDGEALVAMRRANAMLRDAGLTWEQIIGKPPIVEVKIERQQPDYGWEDMMNEFHRQMRSGKFEQRAGRARRPPTVEEKIMRLKQEGNAAGRSAAGALAKLHRAFGKLSSTQTELLNALYKENFPNG